MFRGSFVNKRTLYCVSKDRFHFRCLFNFSLCSDPFLILSDCDSDSEHLNARKINTKQGVEEGSEKLFITKSLNATTLYVRYQNFTFLPTYVVAVDCSCCLCVGAQKYVICIQRCGQIFSTKHTLP